MQQYKKEFIEFMIECGVLTFGDFITKSGRKTPFFVNTGNYKTGSQLKRLGEFYAAAIKENFPGNYNIVFGPAYKGIPLSVTVAMALSDKYGIDVSYCSNRKEVKDHGDTGILLGSKLNDGDKVLIVEDVTTSGKSIYETMPILKGCADVTVNDMFISVNRCEVGQNPGKTAVMEVMEEFGIQVHSIVTVKDIHDYLVEQGTDADILAHMEQYMEQYCVF